MCLAKEIVKNPNTPTHIEARKLDNAESHRCGSIELKGVNKLRSQLHERMSSYGIEMGCSSYRGRN